MPVKTAYTPRQLSVLAETLAIKPKPSLEVILQVLKEKTGLTISTSCLSQLIYRLAFSDDSFLVGCSPRRKESIIAYREKYGIPTMGIRLATKTVGSSTPKDVIIAEENMLVPVSDKVLGTARSQVKKSASAKINVKVEPPLPDIAVTRASKNISDYISVDRTKHLHEQRVLALIDARQPLAKSRYREYLKQGSKPPLDSLNLPFNKLSSNLSNYSCRWVTVDEPERLFCGNPALPGKVFCEHHHMRTVSINWMQSYIVNKAKVIGGT